MREQGIYRRTENGEKRTLAKSKAKRKSDHKGHTSEVLEHCVWSRKEMAEQTVIAKSE
jgi:hypothetical protein